MSNKQSIVWSKGDYEPQGDEDAWISTLSYPKIQQSLTQLSSFHSVKSSPKKVKLNNIEVSPPPKRFKTVPIRMTRRILLAARILV